MVKINIILIKMRGKNTYKPLRFFKFPNVSGKVSKLILPDKYLIIYNIII